jgi:hypothetical protein
MRELAAELRRMGHTVTSRWLEESSRPDCGTLPDGRSRIAPPEDRGAFAAQDIEDVRAADVVVSFTESDDAPASRGGRHVEYGAAFAWGKRLVVVGHRENVFHHLPGVEFYPSQWDMLRALAAEAASTLGPNDPRRDRVQAAPTARGRSSPGSTPTSTAACGCGWTPRRRRPRPSRPSRRRSRTRRRPLSTGRSRCRPTGCGRARRPAAGEGRAGVSTSAILTAMKAERVPRGVRGLWSVLKTRFDDSCPTCPCSTTTAPACRPGFTRT